MNLFKLTVVYQQAQIKAIQRERCLYVAADSIEKAIEFTRTSSPKLIQGQLSQEHACLVITQVEYMGEVSVV